MKLRLLPSTFDGDGKASEKQHFSSFVIDGCVAFDAGSLAFAANDFERENIRDVVLSHAHLDHIAGLPLFIDDLFSTLTEPIRVHAEGQVIETLEKFIFNWTIYPRFSELTNRFGKVIEYHEFELGQPFPVKHLNVRALAVNHKVPSSGFIIDNGSATIAITGDTAEMSEFWKEVNECASLSALLIECAFPNEFEELASISHHLTPARLSAELTKFRLTDIPIFAINIKPANRDLVIDQLRSLKISGVEVLRPNREYDL
ncbi:MAG: MBL fold metallo-hydrolase [Pyrinomonadaceae bacterium]